MSLCFAMCTRGANFTSADGHQYNTSLFSAFVGILLSDILQPAMWCLHNQCFQTFQFALDLVYDGMLSSCGTLLSSSPTRIANISSNDDVTSSIALMFPI
ncbi:hypothetical protein QCA50_015337 [Cerrena zonata]|uniref:Uncharacterized protein n=1 Tax=Cerrena zonata TaxID=2478898 RepID=A0AAW0FRC1_9APHY